MRFHGQSKTANRCNGKGPGIGDVESSTDPVSSALLNSCLSRVSAWQVPPCWSRLDWLEERRAYIVSAAWQAVCDYDSSRNVPLPAFVYRRVIADSLTRYRR